MKPAPHGGYAFPQAMTQAANGDMWVSGDMGEGGMELRDYFAGRALSGWLSDLRGVNASDPGWQAWTATTCYAMADAMLAARAKGGAR